MSTEDEFTALFAPEPDALPVTDIRGERFWKVMLVDDAEDIHAVLRLTLEAMVVEGLPLRLIDAYSAAEAEGMLASHPDTALILLDVVMETDDAGLTLVRHVRQQLANRIVRIVLLTGQPGYRLQRDVIARYEIDDYRLKSDLSADKLFTCVYAELRTYQALQNLEKKRPFVKLASDLQQANRQLQVEIAERQHAQEVANLQVQDLIVLNKKLEDAQNQLLQSEKLASIGLLASGVAHEINNPIGFVNSNLGTLKGHAEELLTIIRAYEAAEADGVNDAPGRFAVVRALKASLELDYLKEDVVSLLTESQEGLARVRKIIRSLKDFSRIETTETWRYDDIQQGLESTLGVVWNELKYKCEVRKEYAELPLVECVLSHLNQVFMNLLVNAAHAIKERGVLSIRTGCKGDEVWVEIADTGEGISPENLPHLFEPFFTTKPVGQGTGLGLSLSYGIVEKHHGRIEVDSTLGQGSTFRVWLPVCQPETTASTGTPQGEAQ